jgi:hypothetical protein
LKLHAAGPSRQPRGSETVLVCARSVAVVNQTANNVGMPGVLIGRG